MYVYHGVYKCTIYSVFLAIHLKAATPPTSAFSSTCTFMYTFIFLIFKLALHLFWDKSEHSVWKNLGSEECSSEGWPLIYKISKKTHTSILSRCLSLWMRSLPCPVSLKHCLCVSKPELERRASRGSDTSPHRGFMVVYVSKNSKRDTERQPDRPTKRPCFWAWFVFVFSSPPLLSHGKGWTIGGNGKKMTLGGLGREKAGWVGGWMDEGRDTEREGGHKGEPVTLT